MAAGLGFKTFTTGEVLTAADTNGYLMQGILVFATEAARNSAITSPQEGQFAFTKDTNSTWYYDGAAWVASGASGDVTGVTAGTGISVTNPTGPVPTVAIDTAVTVDKTTAQTLTNKTLTSPALTTPTISTLTTNGDLLYGTGSGALSRIGIGSTSQVLTVSGGIPAWAAPAGASANFELLNSGGTALTGSATVTVSGISGKNQLYIVVIDGGSASAGADIRLRLNTDTAGNYSYMGIAHIEGTGSDQIATTSGATAYTFAVQGNSASNVVAASILVSGTNTSGRKPITSTSWANGTASYSMAVSGDYKGTSAISSISINSSLGNLDEGTVYVYGA